MTKSVSNLLRIVQQHQLGKKTIGRRGVVTWILLVLWIFGLGRTKNSSPLYLVYQFVMHFVFSFLYTLAMCVRLFQIDNTAELIAACGMTLTLVALVVKFINLNFYYPTIIMDILCDTESFVLVNAVERQLVRERMRFFTIVSIVYYAMANTCILSSFVATGLSKTLPYFGAYPLDWQQNALHYWLVYGFQVAGMLMLCSTNVMIELLPGFCMFITSVRMEILAQRLSALNGRSALQTLVGCIKLHQNLLR